MGAWKGISESSRVTRLYAFANGLLKDPKPANCRKAVALLDQALKIDPACALAWMLKGSALGMVDDPGAADCLRKALDGAKNDPPLRAMVEQMLYSLEVPKAKPKRRR